MTRGTNSDNGTTGFDVPETRIGADGWIFSHRRPRRHPPAGDSGSGYVKIDMRTDDKLNGREREHMSLLEGLDLCMAAGDGGTMKRRIIEKCALLVLSAIRGTPSLQRQMRAVIDLLRPQVDISTAIKLALVEAREQDIKRFIDAGYKVPKKEPRPSFIKGVFRQLSPPLGEGPAMLIRDVRHLSSVVVQTPDRKEFAVERASWESLPYAELSDFDAARKDNDDRMAATAPEPRAMKDVPEINIGQKRCAPNGDILILVEARDRIVMVRRDESENVFGVTTDAWNGLKIFSDPAETLSIRVGRLLPRAYGGGVAYYVDGNAAEVTVNRLGGGGNNFKISRAMWEDLPFSTPSDTSIALFEIAERMDAAAAASNEVISGDGKLTPIPTDQSSDAKAKSIGDWRDLPAAMGGGSVRRMAEAEGYVMVRKVGRAPMVLQSNIWNGLEPSKD